MNDSSRSHPFARTLRIIIGIAVVFTLGMHFGSSRWLRGEKPAADAYQAVTLVGNQMYIGKLKRANRFSPVLTDVYYVQSKSGSLEKPETQTFTLRKLGGELHGPEDMMVLNAKNILYWENLRDDSRIVQAIKTEKANRAVEKSPK